MLKDFVDSIGRMCARRRGDCLGMSLAGLMLVRLASSSPGNVNVAFDLFGSTLLLFGLASTAAAMLYRRA